MAKTIKSIADAQSRRQIIEHLMQETTLSRKQVTLLLETLGTMVVSHMKKGGSGKFVIPFTGVQVVRRTRKAMPKRQGRNPSTGEAITIKAKPAHIVIKARVLKMLQAVI